MSLSTNVRAVILTNRQGNQIALINKLAQHIDIPAVVFSNNMPKRTPGHVDRAKIFINRVGGRFFGKRFRVAWSQMLGRYEQMYPNVPVENQIVVDNVNDQATIDVIEAYLPDLVLVSGTNLVGSKVIDAAQVSGKIMNLHTGISPYVKGGPNCTNWCLSNGWFHLIGNTIMWLDKGIDTGNIIATERTNLDGTEDLFELHYKVMEHAHGMYINAVKRISSGEHLNNIPQSTVAKGNLFKSVQWGPGPMRRALRNFRRDYRPYFTNKAPRLSEEIKLFPF